MKYKNWTGVAGLAVVLSFFGLQIQAQDCADYFPVKEGTVLEYVNYDRKDKMTGSSETAFLKKQETPEGMSAMFSSKFRDDKGEVLFENEMQAECKDGVLYFDASSLLDPASMSAYESMDVKVTGDNLELPLNSGPGTELADGGVTATISSGGVKILTLSVNLTNRKIQARETVETPAGSFECIKYTYDARTEMGFVKMDISGIEWYNHKHGTIRSESYDKKGKLSGYTVLESISN